MPKFTPMMEQYLNIKNEYKYALVFFRLGDFYELFFDDALVASKALDITLTARDCGQEERAPMCGVPYHAAEGYIARLVEKGFKVAICEQTEDPKQTKTIVKREVVRVITPGTVTDTNVLDATKNHFICAIYEDKTGMGIATADVSTGEFFATTLTGKQSLIDELSKLAPSEIIANPHFTYEEALVAMLKTPIATCEQWSFDYMNAHKTLCDHFRVQNLYGFGLGKEKHGVCAAGALLTYLEETQKNALTHISAIKPYKTEDFMLIDASSRRNLELTETMREKSKKGTLLSVLDTTKTAMGARMLRKWVEQPLVEKEQIQNRLDAVDEFRKDPLFREEIKDCLKLIHDIERLAGKFVYATANPRDCISLKQSLLQLPLVQGLLSRCQANLNSSFCQQWDNLLDVWGWLEETIVEEPPVGVREGGFIKPGIHEKLDAHREAKQKGADWLFELETREKEATGIKNLKVKYNKIFGYHMEVTNSYQHLVPEHFIRRQTLANCERYTTEELKKIEDAILGADAHINEIEYSIFVALRDKVASAVKRLQYAANAVATIDCLQSLGEVADALRYTKPTINTNGQIEIEDGRHPVVEQMATKGFVPNDTHLDEKTNRLVIITGPNMAGKSTYMRQVALIVLMAQMGSFVPAKKASIGICDRIFTRVGASDDLALGQSTFMVEMSEVANIVNNATKNSLIILDEIGRGTSTYDGLSIAWAVLEYIADAKTLGAKTLFATHYHELTELEGKVEGVINCCVTVKEEGEDIVFLRKIVRGGADHSYGIQVARLAGVPQSIIDRSKHILKVLNQSDIAKKPPMEQYQPNEKTQEPFYYGNNKKASKAFFNDIVSFNIETLDPTKAVETLREWKQKIKELSNQMNEEMK